jgi:hypothetical protein
VRIRPVLPDDRGFVIAAAHRLASFGPPAWRPSEDIVNAEARTLEAFFSSPPASSALLIAESEGNRLRGEPGGAGRV